MNLITINRKPDPRQLRQFGVVSLIALPIIGWLCGASPLILSGLALVGALVAATAFIRPQWIKPLFVALSVITAPLGIVVSELALLLIYLGCILPVAILFRVIRRDALQRNFESDKSTYWQSKPPAPDPVSYYRQS